MARDPHRFRLHRAGILNVWQYDEQIFDFADGRLLLRGTNGAGKSKTMEMLLPFVLDGDKARMTATGRQSSQLLWLMSDGASSSGTRTGYVWVELARTDSEGQQHLVTCAVGIRHSASAKTATTWQFTAPTGAPTLLEPDGVPLSQPRCRELVDGIGGRLFESPREYKAHVGKLLFGLEPQAYDDLLRLLYWLRQPQVGEDLDPTRLAGMLDESLPALDEVAVRQVGEALDDLAAHGESLDRLRAATAAITSAAELYARYACTTVQARAILALEAEAERAARARAVQRAADAVDRTATELAAVTIEKAEARDSLGRAASQEKVLADGPLVRNQQVLQEKQRRADDLARAAEQATGAATRAVDRAENSAARVADGEQSLARLGDDLAEHTRDAAATSRECGLTSGLPTALDPVPQATAIGADAPLVLAEVGTARAAVTVVRESARQRADASTRRDAAAESAAQTEQREEQAAGRLADARRTLAQLSQAWTDDTHRWLAERPELDLAVPAAVEHSLADWPRSVRDAANPSLESWRSARETAQARLGHARDRLTDLANRRREVEAETEPAPPPPALPRPDRDPRIGTQLWRLVEAAPAPGAEGRTDPTLIEAALEAAGLLDAQILADGSMRSSAGLDTILTAGPGLAGDTLADLLTPAPPVDSPVSADTVTAVLASIALRDTADLADRAETPVALGRDGSWRVGNLTGRATKPAAQYLGVAARAAERARRLAEIDEAVAATDTDRAAADAAARTADAELERLQSWMDRQPATDPLVRASVQHTEREEAHEVARTDTARLHGVLSAAADILAQRTEQLTRLCAEHRLPSEPGALQSRSDALARLDTALAQLVDEARRLLTAARRLEEDDEAADRDHADAEAAAAEAADARRLAADARAESDALLATLGVEVARLQAQLAEARAATGLARKALAAVDTRLTTLTGQAGEHRARLTAARERLADAEPAVAQCCADVVALRTVPGLLAATWGRELTEAEALALDGLVVSPPPRPTLAVLRDWAALAVDRPADSNAVHAELRTLAVGPAAETEPRVVPVGDVLAALGRDPAGAERPLAELAGSMASQVAREQELLTERERALFEEHLLGELGDSLRTRRQEATDLVRGMNDLLADVRTSQGIRVRLDWALRDDVGADVRDAVALLGRARGSLTPDEATRLRDTLGGLIELQRAAEPEHGYAEHLARALDYRRWSAFAVRLHRPGTEGWTTLTRRTPLSQGEQKVVCYLPLFAAAAAHFTSVAGAAPHAPRLILLDDAFPKIDIRTHPLLFGLLVDLDLDFILTSERLWGDHASVPSLAVYEALRAPGERGIAQYRYTWDGHTLTGQA
jgi:uncharacterized protein (TIGR02680 family)